MHPQEGLGHTRVPELVVLRAQQAPKQLLHQPQGKGGQRDQDGGVGDGEGLALAPHGQDHVREFLEEGQ